MLLDLKFMKHSEKFKKITDQTIDCYFGCWITLFKKYSLLRRKTRLLTRASQTLDVFGSELPHPTL